MNSKIGKIASKAYYTSILLFSRRVYVRGQRVPQTLFLS